MDIAIDFDGTCVTHEFPNVGKDIGAQKVLKMLVEKGHNLILYTMRSDHRGEEVKSPEFPGVFGGNYLTDAINWFKDNNIPLYGIQKNPTQDNWTTSPKCYAQLYIDDAALGCPLKQDYIEDDKGLAINFKGRPYVDWNAVENILKKQGIL